MTSCNYLYITAISLVVIGWGSRVHAEGDVTVVPPPPSTNAPPVVAIASDGSPVIHKSSHKKKKSAVAIAASTATGGTTDTSPTKGVASSSTSKPDAKTAPTSFTVSTGVAKLAPIDPPPVRPKPVVTNVVVADALPGPASTSLNPTVPDEVTSSLVPTVETGLPIARHSATDDSDYKSPSESYRTTIASSLPLLSSPAANDSSPSGDQPANESSNPNDNYDSVDSEKRTRTYPWKRDIITTEFWIGEPGSNISATDNIGSAWDENWRSSNGGSDSPDDRQGYLTADHAPRVNPFYVALPFNDLAYPDQARRWLPEGWERRPRDGKQVSACKDRWVEIKNQQGDICYAQWEDVGPLTSDHPEYVFGDERPDTYTRAGLDVSPAVAKYLGIEPEGRNRLTAWRFVDAEDVPPGYWLKYDEEALIYAALHDLNNKKSPDMDDDPSIQHSIAPPDDPSQINANEKKVGAAKG